MKTKIKKILNEKEKIEKKRNIVTTKGNKKQGKRKYKNYGFSFPPKKGKKRKKGNINIKVSSKIYVNKNNQIINSKVNLDKNKPIIPHKSKNVIKISYNIACL